MMLTTSVAAVPVIRPIFTIEKDTSELDHVCSAATVCAVLETLLVAFTEKPALLGSILVVEAVTVLVSPLRAM
jgi:hypothetical protein